MNIQKIRSVWDANREHLTPNFTGHDLEEINSRLASFYCPGPFYFYVFDFRSIEFAYMSDSYEEILGQGREGLNIELFLKNVHPDDLEYFSQCEQTAAKFLFEYIDPAKMLDYKVSYCYRIKTADQNYRLFLHQVIGLTMDSENRLGKVLGVHSDISHITQTNNHKISFFGINGEPSFTNIEVLKPDATVFKPDEQYNLTEREIEVLRLLSEGASSKDIGTALFISEKTVRKHREHLLKKTNSKNSSHLVANAIRNGLI